MSRVLVTGATGFIGRGSLAPLLDSGAEVHAVTSQQPPSWSAPEVHWHRIDLLTEAGAHAAAAIGASHLLHFAWYAEPGRFWTSPQNLAWLGASLRLISAFADAGGRRLVIAGTCAEYEWGPNVHCVEATTPLRPATLYGVAKHALHDVATAYAREVDLSLAWGRVFFTFGPHESAGRLASSVATAALRGEPALCTLGDQVRDFLYAPELAAAFAALVLSDVTGAVNVASGSPIPLRELITELASAAGRPDLVRLGARPTPAHEPVRLTASVDRLRDEVGWTPSLSLQEAAARTIAWWRTR